MTAAWVPAIQPLPVSPFFLAGGTASPELLSVHVLPLSLLTTNVDSRLLYQSQFWIIKPLDVLNMVPLGHMLV